jgi:SAM-dependent methyltransferase
MSDRPPQQSSYAALARFYDAIQGDRADHAAYLRDLIEKHHPRARTVLELACGTGSILKQLQGDYELTGVDLSEPMLAHAAVKVPAARLVAADMTAFHLDETFDVVLCVYDSINHLLRFEQWQSLFDRAHEHLAERGIFIFDINTERRLEWLVDQPPEASWFDGANLLLLDVRDASDGVGVIWDLKIFEHRGGADYRLHEEEIREVSFPVEQIKELAGRFRRVRVYDQQRARPSPRSGRLHFVCTR